MPVTRAMTEGGALGIIAEKVEGEYLARLGQDIGISDSDVHRDVMRQVLKFEGVRDGNKVKVHLKYTGEPADEGIPASIHEVALSTGRIYGFGQSVGKAGKGHGTFNVPLAADAGSMVTFEAATIEDLASGLNASLGHKLQIDVKALLGRPPG